MVSLWFTTDVGNGQMITSQKALRKELTDKGFKANGGYAAHWSSALNESQLERPRPRFNACEIAEGEGGKAGLKLGNDADHDVRQTRRHRKSSGGKLRVGKEGRANKGWTSFSAVMSHMSTDFDAKRLPRALSRDALLGLGS